MINLAAKVKNIVNELKQKLNVLPCKISIFEKDLHS